MKLMAMAAFPQELKYVLRNASIVKKTEKGPFTIYVSRYLSHELTAVLTGIGPIGPESGLAEVIDWHGPDFIASIGFGGALYEGAKKGELVWGEECRLAGSNEAVRFGAENKKVFERLRLRLDISAGAIITVGARTPKPKLVKTIPPQTRFPVCDMETFYMERLAQGRGAPFFAIRSITDTLDEEIPEELFDVCDESGRYSAARALRAIVMNPGLIPASIRLGLGSAVASKSLFRAIKALVETLQ